jgi:hypothetical protein
MMMVMMMMMMMLIIIIIIIMKLEALTEGIRFGSSGEVPGRKGP